MKHMIGLCMFLALFCASSSSEALATTRRVPADHPTIQQAINASINGDTVIVSPGTYVENINFLGKAITVVSEAGPDVTIIDGNQADTVVMFVSGEGAASVIKGFTIRNGFATSNTFNGGGGILISASAPTVMDNVITNNGASSNGGGISVGGISVGAAPKIANNKIINNKACNGAGIASTFSSPIIQNNLISGNKHDFCIGGVGGGGILIGGESSAQIIGNTISNNSTGPGGGISLFASGPTLIRDNVISGNQATAEGGGIDISNSSPALIINNLIIGNKAGAGGGISWSSHPDSIINNTIAYNDSPRGSAFLVNATQPQTHIFNNILVAKPGQSAIFCDISPGTNPFIINSNNVFSLQGAAYEGDCPDQTGIRGNISADPLFVNPASDYHLRADSPSIDAGDNTAANLPDKDIDGNPRIRDGNKDGIPIVDMGAYEFSMPFDTCIQDDSSGSILRINTSTGDYQFTNCSGLTIDGKGSLTRKGNILSLQHMTSDRRVTVKLDGGVNKATASIQMLAQGLTLTIMDRNTTNNTCSCK